MGALHLAHNVVDIALIGCASTNIVRLLLRSPGTWRTIGHHSDGKIGHATFTMYQLHHVIHTQAAGHAIIILAVNERASGGIEPASTDKGCIRIRVRGLQVSTQAPLAVPSDNPAQRGQFTI